jgi:hypothetical protein
MPAKPVQAKPVQAMTVQAKPVQAMTVPVQVMQVQVLVTPKVPAGQRCWPTCLEPGCPAPNRRWWPDGGSCGSSA